MTTWQRRARLATAVFGLAIVVLVVRGVKRREPPPALPPIVRTDPTAIIEGTGATTARITGTTETFRVSSERQLSYEDGTGKLIGVEIQTTERDGSRIFTLKGNESRIGRDESEMSLDGDVVMKASDGLVAHMERATYVRREAVVRAPGPVGFERGRVSGDGVGMTYDNHADVLTLVENAVVRIAPDDAGTGGLTVTSGSAVFARREKVIRFDGGVRVVRPGESIASDTAVARLSDDEKRVQAVELHGRARMTTTGTHAGGLQSMAGQDINLTYADDGQTLHRAQIVGEAVSTMAGEAGATGREIAADVIDVALADDGATPTSLLARQSVQLTLPAEGDAPARIIRAVTLDAKGEAGVGLTRAAFAGSVQFRERGARAERSATSDRLDVGLAAGMSTIEDARFIQAVRFQDGTMTALAASASYDPAKGTLALSGSEPGAVVPHVANEQIAVDAARIDVTLEGPRLKADGNVRSQLQPPKKSEPGSKEAASDLKLPSMLKQDQPVIVVADKMDYDGAKSRGTYTGAARLFQGETSIKGGSITIDDRNGDLLVSGGVTSASVLEEVDKDKNKTRTPSAASAKALKYEDATRRLTYAGDAHLTGPDGDMTAGRIELYLKASGNEIDRAEAFDGVTLREQGRKTTGNRLSYAATEEKYVVTGAPVSIVDGCGRESVGRTLTFIRSTDTIVLDGNDRVRTQNKSGGKCP